jgi:O-antigen/teichoic acid export membrane protein
MEDGARGLGFPVVALKAEATSLVVSVVMLLLLLDRFSIRGAAIASLVGYSSASLVLARFARRHTGARYADVLLPRRSDLGLVSISALRAKLRSARAQRHEEPVDDDGARR